MATLCYRIIRSFRVCTDKVTSQLLAEGNICSRVCLPLQVNGCFAYCCMAFKTMISLYPNYFILPVFVGLSQTLA